MTTHTPVPSYSTDPAEVSFRAALTHIQDPWIYGFLFPSQTTYQQQLQQALLQQHRLTADMSITSLSPSSEQFSLNESIRFLLLPSFSTGPVSVAYQVTEYVNTGISEFQSPYIARCVRDDVNGIYLTIGEAPTTGLTEVTCCMQKSPGFREHIFMVLDTPSFRDVMRKLANGEGYDTALMTDALVYTFKSFEIRDCPACGARSSPCTCPLQLVRKTHPMDFDADIINLRSYMGSYDGLSYQAIYAGGVNVYNGIDNTRACVEFSYDNDGKRRLESWTLQYTLKERNINLFKLSMPDFDMFEPPVIESIDDAVDSDTCGKQRLTCSPLTDDRDVPTDAEIDRFMSDGNTHGTASEELLDLENIDDATIAQYEGSVQSATASTMILPENHSASAVSSRAHSSTAHEVEQSKQTQNEAEQPRAPDSPCFAIESTIRTRTLQPQAKPQTSKLFADDAITRPRRMGRPPAPKLRAITRVVPIEPAANTTAVASVQKAINTFSDEVRRKAELRKARNRASAVRSNERKKKQLQELRHDLEETKKKEAALRQQEQGLRETNLKLRAKLSD